MRSLPSLPLLPLSCLDVVDPFRWWVVAGRPLAYALQVRGKSFLVQVIGKTIVLQLQQRAFKRRELDLRGADMATEEKRLLGGKGAPECLLPSALL